MPFLDNVTFPVVSANMDVTREPRLQGKFASSHVFTVGGEKVGVIGFITEETAFISTPGKEESFVLKWFSHLGNCFNSKLQKYTYEIYY